MRLAASQGLRPLRSLLSQASVRTYTHTPSSRLFLSQLYNPRNHQRQPALYQPWHMRFLLSYRQNSTSSRPLSEEPSNKSQTDAEREKQNAERRKNEEAYQIVFTCKPCGERSSHRMSKQGYHRGTVLIQCPSCQSRHVMSDHLGIFFDKRTTLEDLLKEKGQTLTHGVADGNLEFWDDGTVKSFDLDGQQRLDSSSAGEKKSEKSD
ncbi:hypothetical protein N7462_011644 [Penicillium macrosclerotiorum]|uniref:uncharacterized protein n=1 Tax=Penicillium macrosclerotiorum TaxID=303699 RepID=UPI002547AAC8|nr:uncharacterized protein N7462_011644 [Penicillium macrosclerotiorum]KAJ5662718.1 hypothetical protein N7462_011644 [Penicillium macrosclerotiorum]